MKNLSIILFCFFTIACSAQKKIETLNINGTIFKVASQTLNQGYKEIKYSDINNRWTETIPGYTTDLTEQYVDQNLIHLDEKKILQLVREIANGKTLASDKFETLIINFYLDPTSGKILELNFYNFFITQPFPKIFYPELDDILKKQITAKIKTDRYKKYSFVRRTVLLKYADLAVQE
jgi:hypothetical protein